jgi:hypothetical protein
MLGGMVEVEVPFIGQDDE